MSTIKLVYCLFLNLLNFGNSFAHHFVDLIHFCYEISQFLVVFQFGTRLNDIEKAIIGREWIILIELLLKFLFKRLLLLLNLVNVVAIVHLVFNHRWRQIDKPLLYLVNDIFAVVVEFLVIEIYQNM